MTNDEIESFTKEVRMRMADVFITNESIGNLGHVIDPIIRDVIERSRKEVIEEFETMCLDGCLCFNLEHGTKMFDSFQKLWKLMET